MVHNRNNECICPLQRYGLVRFQFLLFVVIASYYQPIVIRLSQIYTVHVFDQTEYLAGVTPFIIIERDQLEKVGVNLNAFSCIEAGSMRIAYEVGRYHFVINIVQNTSKLVFTASFSFWQISA